MEPNCDLLTNFRKNVFDNFLYGISKINLELGKCKPYFDNLTQGNSNETKRSCPPDDPKSDQYRGITIKGSNGDLPAKDKLRELYMLRANLYIPSLEGALLSPPFSLDNIVRASINWELLSKPLDFEISVHATSVESFKRGVGLLLNNYNRVCSVLETFQMRVEQKSYPSMPATSFNKLFGKCIESLRLNESCSCAVVSSSCDDIEQVQLNCASSGNEQSPLVRAILRFIIDWPSLVCEVASRSLPPSDIILCIKNFNKEFNKYYKSCRVLAPSNAPHQFEEMYKHIFIYECLKPMMVQMFEILSCAVHKHKKQDERILL